MKKNITAHIKHLIEKGRGLVSIHSRFNKLLILLRSAVEKEDKLDKEATATQNGIPGIVTQQTFESWGLHLTDGLALGFAIGFYQRLGYKKVRGDNYN
jgi:hypothetical protein